MLCWIYFQTKILSCPWWSADVTFKCHSWPWKLPAASVTLVLRRHLFVPIIEGTATWQTKTAVGVVYNQFFVKHHSKTDLLKSKEAKKKYFDLSSCWINHVLRRLVFLRSNTTYTKYCLNTVYYIYIHIRCLSILFWKAVTVISTSNCTCQRVNSLQTVTLSSLQCT